MNSAHQAADLLPSSATILLVDDQPMGLEILKASLGEQYTLFTATSGEEVLEKVESHRPDLILLDVILGGMDGIEVCRQLKTDVLTQDIPVIFLTSLESEADENTCWEAGAADFISKPYNISTLLHRVKSQLTVKFHADLLKKLACMDGLTRLYNHSFFDQQLQLSIKQQQREGVDMVLLMLDVDFFKKLNDTHGHPTGDECLRWIARVMEHAARRPRDLIARYGGEEFVILLFDTDLAAGENIANSIGELVRSNFIPHECRPQAPLIQDQLRNVTVSIGMARRRGTDTYPAETLLANADKALYQAKHSGRDRVEVYERMMS